MKHDEQWEYNFALLQEYYAQYGAFPFADVVYRDIRLGKWCSNQKLLVKAGKCTANRFEKLRRWG